MFPTSSILLLIILLGALVFLKLFWYITDPRPIKTVVKQNTSKKALKLMVLELVKASLLVITTLFFPLPRTPFDFLITAIGLLIFSTGFIISIWSKLTMKKSWGPTGYDHNIKTQKVLIVTGPYSFSRNPIYLSIFLLSLGIFITFRSYLIIFSVFTIWKFYKASLKEEQVLEKVFGEKYITYKKKVRLLL